MTFDVFTYQIMFLNKYGLIHNWTGEQIIQKIVRYHFTKEEYKRFPRNKRIAIDSISLSITPFKLKQLLNYCSSDRLKLLSKFYDGGLTFQRFAPEWATESVISLAIGIKETESFDRMLILADALEEAGCNDLEVLQHLRTFKIFTRYGKVLRTILRRQ